MIGVAELLLQTDLTIEQRTYVETIRSSGDTLLALINDVLDLSKVRQPNLNIFPSLTIFKYQASIWHYLFARAKCRTGRQGCGISHRLFLFQALFLSQLQCIGVHVFWSSLKGLPSCKEDCCRQSLHPRQIIYLPSQEPQIGGVTF